MEEDYQHMRLGGVGKITVTYTLQPAVSTSVTLNPGIYVFQMRSSGTQAMQPFFNGRTPGAFIVQNGNR